MAEENEDGQEKSEDPSERRLEKGLEDGQVARSKELATLLSLMFGMIAMYFAGSMLAEALAAIGRDAFTISRGELADKSSMATLLGESSRAVIGGIIVVGGAGMIAAIAGNLGVGGFLLSAKSLMPKGSRMNPLQGLKRMFSANSLVELVKSVLKVALTAGIGGAALWVQLDILLSLADMPIEQAIEKALTSVLLTVLYMVSGLILVAALDVPYQLYEHKKKMRMTLKEVKDEFKETEGSPELKARVRQVQREMANRRMMQKVPDADVIVTNPTHYAIALKYDPHGGGAPTVLAKGKDELAMRIREKASEHGVARLETPPLARALYHSVDIDQEIPAGLYVAVAQVLAYVFQLNEHFKGRAQRPAHPSNLPIPTEFRVDPD